MSDDLEAKTTAVMLAMSALKRELTNAPLDEAMQQRDRIQEIVGLGNGLLLLWQEVDDARDASGMDFIEKLREMETP